MSGDQHLLGNHPVNLDAWVHVAVTLSGTTARAYVNGVLDATGEAGQPTTCSVDQTIGASYTPWYFFRGSLDDVRVYDRACSADEILGLYSIPEPVTVASAGAHALCLLAYLWCRRRCPARRSAPA